jgi:hypothetical protein
MATPRLCRHCGDPLPDDAPAHVTSCRGWYDCRAGLAGDLLDDATAQQLRLYRHFCEWSAALRDGMELIPELPA